MNGLINGKLTAEDFSDQFLCLWEKDGNTFELDCEPNISSKGFGKWIDKVFSDCEMFDQTAQKNEQYGEKWLKDSISSILIQIQKEYNSN